MTPSTRRRQFAVVGVQRHAELIGQRLRTLIEAGQAGQNDIGHPRRQLGVYAGRSCPRRRSRAYWLHGITVLPGRRAGRRVPPRADELELRLGHVDAVLTRHPLERGCEPGRDDAVGRHHVPDEGARFE